MRRGYGNNRNNGNDPSYGNDPNYGNNRQLPTNSIIAVRSTNCLVVSYGIMDERWYSDDVIILWIVWKDKIVDSFVFFFQ